MSTAPSTTTPTSANTDPCGSSFEDTGASRIGTVLRLAAVSLQRSKTALGAAFRRIARQRSAKVAVFATARKLAQLVYRLLRYGQHYVDIGERQYEARYEHRRLQALKATARQLGYGLVREAAGA